MYAIQKKYSALLFLLAPEIDKHLIQGLFGTLQNADIATDIGCFFFKCFFSLKFAR